MTTILVNLDTVITKIGMIQPGDIFISAEDELCILINRAKGEKSLIKSFFDNRSYTESNDSQARLVKKSSIQDF